MEHKNNKIKVPRQATKLPFESAILKKQKQREVFVMTSNITELASILDRSK